ncbi:hypothetical protein [Streptomyces sp. NPDC093795]|uniref:hypothetical protein n=1 Tax=Streptomyces sp. NPDC093795 TaxID=3366051 RepID=UPI00382F5D03
MSDFEPVAVAVITLRAQERLKELGATAAEAVESLRQELELNPRLGLPKGKDRGPRGKAFMTHLEARPGMPGLTVGYLYMATPAPPGVAITVIVPDDSAEFA